MQRPEKLRSDSPRGGWTQLLGKGSPVPELADGPIAAPAWVTFIKTDCPACHLALRYLDALSRQLPAPAHIVAVSQDGAESTRELKQSLGLDLDFRHDERLTASRAYDLEAVPAMFLLDRDGVIVESSQGFDKNDLNRFAATLAAMAEVAAPPPVSAHDGNPNFQPGCVSRHLEPESDGDEGPRAALYDVAGSRAGRVEVPPESDVDEFCYERGFADPLPVVPPTVERVERALEAVDMAPGEIVAHVPPNYGQATVEKIAANAVMAGCRPEYLRVLVPLVRALCDERLDIHGVQGTTHFAAPLVVINGPVRNELGFACGSNVFSNAARANSTIGRALQLILRNIGGAAPGRIDMSTMGNPGRFSFVIGENEEASPWGPLCEDFGIAAGTDAATLYCAEPPRPVSEHKARTAEVLLRAMCPVLANLWSYRVCRRPEALVVIGPEHAETLRRSGYSKTDVIDHLFEHTGVPVREYDGDGGEGTHESGSYEECVIRGVRCYRKFRSPESIKVMVAGGPAGKFSAVLGSWQTGPKGSQMVCCTLD